MFLPDSSEISSDLSSSHSPSFSLGDNMDVDEDNNVFQSNYNPLQDFIDDVLLNQALPNYDAGNKILLAKKTKKN